MSERAARAAGSVLVAVATAVVVLALAVVPFLNPGWIAFAQARADASAWTGFSPQELRTTTDEILADLVLGPPAFDVTVKGTPVLGPAERAHMRDVRAVFGLAALVAVAAAGVLVASRLVAGGSPAWWRAVRAGAIALGVGILALGAVAALAFEFAFDAFHRVFFSGGNYAFDPATDRLVQLFPLRFWFETSLAVGALALVLSAATAWLAGGRAAIRTGRAAGAAKASLEALR